MLRRAIGGSLTCSLAGAILATSSALAAVPHTVQPGQSLWSIAAANGLTARTVAVYNGLPEDAGLLQGTTLYVPTVDEGAAALASGTAVVSPPATVGTTAPSTTGSAVATSTPAATVPPGMGYVPSPYGDLPLLPGAASAWNSMRAESLSVYGTDLYPAGRSRPTEPPSSRQASTRPTSRATARRPTRPVPRRTNRGWRSTSRAPRCAR